MGSVERVQNLLVEMDQATNNITPSQTTGNVHVHLEETPLAKRVSFNTTEPSALEVGMITNATLSVS